MPEIEKIAEQLVNLTVKQVNELADTLKEKYGIEPPAIAAPVVVASQNQSSGNEVAAKTTFDVILKSAGATKLAVVKAVKELTNLGLKESKDLVDGAPKAVKEGVSRADADSIKAKLEEAGAEVEIK